MKSKNLIHRRAIWILVLNMILILIPISGFYFVYLGNSQALHQRTMSLKNSSNSVASIIDYINSEEAVHVIPVLAPYQRLIVVENNSVIDSGWKKNPVFEERDTFFQFVDSLFLEKTPAPDLDQKEILSRLSKYIKTNTSKTGIINYRFLYSVEPFSRKGRIAGSTILLFDKSDIMKTTKLNKIILVFLTVISGILAILISMVYYCLFIRPLFSLIREARGIIQKKKDTSDIFPLRKRKDEIGQLSQAFYLSASELIKKKEIVESFTSDILHELKNPLTAIRNGVEILEQDARFNKKEAAGVIVDVISRESGRIEKLLYDIKELSMYENQEKTIEYCKPVEVIKNVLSLYKDQGVQCDANDTALHPVLIPEEKLGRIMKNLIDNAIDFSPEFGTVSIRCKRENGRVVITVSDKGTGIADADKRKIFKRFYSNRSGVQAVGLHSGLGLAIVWKILHDYGFSVRCYDNTPSGCCFEISL